MTLETLRISAKAAARTSKGEWPSRLDVPDGEDTIRPSLLELADEINRSPAASTCIEVWDLPKNVSDANGLKKLEALYVLEACMRSRRYSPSTDNTAICSLYERVSAAILPGAELVIDSETTQSGNSTEVSETLEAVSQELKRFIIISSLGTSILKYLDELLPLQDYQGHADVIISLAAFTDITDPWASEVSFANVTYLLAKNHSLTTKPYVLVDHALQGLIRPLFAKSKHPEVTAQGRRALQPSPRIQDSAMAEAEAKPWRSSKIYCLTVFRWVLQNLEEPLVEANWPLAIPPILTLIDDDSPNYKAKGCELLTILLASTPPALLARTGLGDVFYGAVMPCLSYLPSLTPQDQSLRLLGETYPALIALSRARYPSHDKRKERMEMLDQVLRKGVLKGHFHCNDNVKITELFVNQMRVLINEMGIWSVRHLKDIIPLLSDILSDPFGAVYPPLIAATLRTLQAIILTDWPRIAAHRAEVLRGLTFCWLVLTEDETESQNIREMKQGVVDAVEMLKAALRTEVDIDADIKLLVQSDGRLTKLFNL